MNSNEKILALKEEIEGNNISYLQLSLEKIISTNAEILQSIFDSKPKLEIGEVYIETLIMKIIFSSKSLIDLSKGTELNLNKFKVNLEIIDRPSMYILNRSIIECFLTLEYLFFNNLSREEQLFRYNLWRISGFVSRQNFKESLQKSFEEKLLREKKEIEELKVEIKKSKYYSTLKDQDIWKLNTYGLPRVISWSSLLEKSILNKELFESTYKLYSNYAHSEFISIIQINEGSLHKTDEFNLSSVFSTLYISRLINCITIILLKEKFECASLAFESIDEKSKYSIEFWNKFGRE
jgi:hypothetical protein